MHEARVNLNKSGENESVGGAFTALTGFLVLVSTKVAWATFAVVLFFAALVFNVAALVILIIVVIVVDFLLRTGFGRRGRRRKRCTMIAAFSSRQVRWGETRHALHLGTLGRVALGIR